MQRATMVNMKTKTYLAKNEQNIFGDMSESPVEGGSAASQNLPFQGYHCADSSNSFIHVLPLSTSRGRVPSGGPTMPSFSMMSIKCAARP